MTVEAWALGDVKTALGRAADENRFVSVEEMRGSVGIGHDDLMEVLGLLRERGEAVESAPGEWRPPYDDEVEGAGAGDDSLPAVADDAPGEGEMGPGRVAAGLAPRMTARTGTATLTAENGQVVLTAKVLAALDAETIGKIVQAGVEEAAGETFTLTVSA